MANPDTPFGLKPVGHIHGATFIGKMTPYYVPATNGTALFIGDAVLLTGDGNAAEVEAPGLGTFPPGTLSTVAIATVGSYITGAIVGFGANPDDLSVIKLPASTEGIAWVADDPGTIFEIQEDNDGTAFTTAVLGLNADLVFGTGSAFTGESGIELDTDTEGTSAALAIRILRLVNRVDNAIGAAAKWEVMINLHSSRYTTGIS